jgi:multidrug efflux pump subunit AcrA (membrane-fusion protein)
MIARIFWVVAAIGLLGVVGWRVTEARAKQASQVARPVDLPVVRTTRVERTDLRETLTFTGNIRARNEVDIFPKVAGRIEELHAAVGDKVRPGEVLAVVEHTEIGWQARNAAAAEQSAAASVQAATAAISLAQTNVEAAQVDYDRTKTLFEAGSAPQAQLDGARVKLDMAKAQLLQARAQATSGQAAVAQTQAASGLAKQQLNNARIESPIVGVVTKRNVLQGTNVGPQTLAFTVQDLSALKLEASVDAASYVKLARGKTADITVEEFPDEVFKGQIDVLAPALDATTRRAAVEIAIENTSGRLLAQMFAKATVEVGQLKGALAVPQDAVLQGAGGALVYRVKNGRTEAVRPKLGTQDGKLVAVLSGLSEGDEVAVTGLGNLSDGLEVKAAKAETAEATLPPR